MGIRGVLELIAGSLSQPWDWQRVMEQKTPGLSKIRRQDGDIPQKGC